MKNIAKTFPLTAGVQNMLLATFYFALMNIFIKAVSHLPTMEIVLFRCGISLLICWYQLRKLGISWRGTNRKLLFFRGVFGTISLFAYFTTITHIPLGTAVTIQYLAPIFTTIIALFILDEKVKPLQWLFFAVSFGGVALMKGLDDGIPLYYLVIGIVSALFSAMAYVTIRTIKEREHPFVVVLHFQLIGTLAGMVFTSVNYSIPQGMDWIYLILVGVCTQLGQVKMTKAFQKDNVANVSIINYIGVLFAIASGIFIFDEKYGLGTLFGILLVIAGVLMSLIYRYKKPTGH